MSELQLHQYCFILNLGNEWYIAVPYLILLVLFSVKYFLIKKFNAIHQLVPVDFENLHHQQFLFPQQITRVSKVSSSERKAMRKRDRPRHSHDGCI